VTMAHDSRMGHILHRTKSRHGLLLALLAGSCVLTLPACGGSSKSSNPRTNLSAQDFAGSEQPEQDGTAASSTQASTSTNAADGGSPPPNGRPSGYNITRTGPVAAREGIDVVSTPGIPAPSATATSVESPVLIDAKVGDVNGRPIFISDFFQTMDARLKTEARNAKDLDAFSKVASEEIVRKLKDIIDDELLQAEARANLTAEERQGFRYWIQSLQSDFVSRNYRSRTMAEQRLAEAQEAVSLEDWTKKREEKELILHQLRSQVFKNVHVPFREIELYYNQKYDDFNPSAERNFRVISVSADDVALIEQVTTELQGGTDFAEIAARPINLFRAKDAGLYIPPRQEAPKANSTEPPAAPKYFQIPAINDAAIRLRSGEWTGPIPNGSSVSFLKLEESQKASTTLYDAQYTIERTLRSDKAQQLMQKYIGDLLKRASVDDVDQMSYRLYHIAIERYWVPQRGLP
jgi:hypothetical protein